MLVISVVRYEIFQKLNAVLDYFQSLWLLDALLFGGAEIFILCDEEIAKDSMDFKAPHEFLVVFYDVVVVQHSVVNFFHATAFGLVGLHSSLAFLTLHCIAVAEHQINESRIFKFDCLFKNLHELELFVLRYLIS